LKTERHATSASTAHADAAGGKTGDLKGSVHHPDVVEVRKGAYETIQR